MAAPNATLFRPPERVPRHIANLNALAELHGLKVRLTVEPYENDPKVALFAEWSGPAGNLLAMLRPMLRPSYHLPLAQGRLNVPDRVVTLLEGDVAVTGDQVTYTVDFGPADFTVSDLGAVEVIAYAHERAYHGSIEALIAVGIPRDRLPTGKRAGKHSSRDWHGCVEQWSSRRQLDGSVVYRVDTAAGLRRRREYAQALYDDGAVAAPPPARSHLRLVVDNTKGVQP